MTKTTMTGRVPHANIVYKAFCIKKKKGGAIEKIQGSVIYIGFIRENHIVQNSKGIKFRARRISKEDEIPAFEYFSTDTVRW